MVDTDMMQTQHGKNGRHRYDADATW